MPLGFSGGQWLSQMGERYGDKLARGIVEAGEKIEQGLERVTTNRQLAGLGETLGALDPNTPDYAQKLIQIAPNFPMAMQDPRGQAMMAIGAKQHAQWQQSQLAMQEMNRQLANQQTMQGLRTRDQLQLINARNAGRTNSEVDLSGMGLPNQLRPQNPAANSGFTFGAGMPSLNSAGGSPDMLMGMEGDLSQNAAPDPLIQRALSPLRDAQSITGIKPTRAQVFSAISSERSRDQQAKMQEDRQLASEKAALKREETAAKRAEATENRFLTALEKGQLRSEITSIEKDISALRKPYESAKKAVDEYRVQYRDGNGDEKEMRRLEDILGAAAADLENAGRERERLQSQLGSPSSAPSKIYRFDPASGDLIPR